MTTSTAQTHFTVEQASRWLTCAQPVPLPLLQRLGKDCSMVCRIRGAKFVDVPVQGKSWPTERGYPAAIIQEVFLANPDTRRFVPKAVATPAPAPRREPDPAPAPSYFAPAAAPTWDFSPPAPAPAYEAPAPAPDFSSGSGGDFGGGGASDSW
jgi:hypothetical protein